MAGNWKKETFQHFFALLRCGFNDHLSSFLSYSHKTLGFFSAFQHPSFLGFQTVKLTWLIHLFYLQSMVVSTVWRLLYSPGRTRVTHGGTGRKCRTSADPLSPEINTHCPLQLCDAQVDTGTFTWSKPRLGSCFQGGGCPKGRTWAPKAGGWSLAPWLHLPIFLEFMVLSAIT